MAAVIESLSKMMEALVNSGSLLAIGVAFLLGVFVGFTPCVYPILPVTVAYIGGISKGKKTSGLFYSLVYVLGMALVYSVVGAIMAVTGHRLGELWGNAWLLLILANFFIFVALWMLGVIRIPTPQFVKGGSRRGGLLGTLGVGAAAGLVVGPCSMPGLVAVATLIAGTADKGPTIGAVLYGVVAMFAYSLGMGVLLIICGTFSGFLANLPKSGRWLNVVEKAFAILMILAAEVFLIHLGQNTTFPLVGSWFTSGVSEPKTGTEAHPQPVGTGQEEPKPEPPAPPKEDPEFETSARGYPEIGKRALEWELQDIHGNTVKLSDFRRKKGVLMDFFATWCAPCMQAIPELIAFQKEFKDQSVEVIGVAVGQPARIIRRLATERGINYTLALDPQDEVAGAYGVRGIPMLFGIDGNGVIRFTDHWLPGDRKALAKELAQGVRR